MQTKRWIGLLAALFLLALTLRILPGPRTIDDAFITFRYARNLLASEGFVFNPGERVLGTTTPLYTLVLAGLGSLAGGIAAPFPWLGLGLNALADGLSAVFLVLIGRQLGARWAGWGAGLAWAVAPFSVTFAIGGLETSVYVLLLVATFWAYLAERYQLTALLAALSLLTRPDALILILPLFTDRLFFAANRRGDRPNYKEGLLFFLPLIAWVLFAWNYFGNPLPHSLIAKTAAYLLPPFSALVRFLQHYATPFQGHLTFGLGWIRFGLLLFPFLALIGARQALRRKASSWPFTLFPWFYLLAFAVANPLIFRWYLTPPLPFYFLCILLGAEDLLLSFFTWLKKHRPIPTLLYRATFPLLLLILPISMLSADWHLKPDHGPQRPAPAMAWIELELLYQQVAEKLQDTLSLQGSSFTLAAGDVGVLAYITEAKILDLVGLNSPQTLEYYPLDPKDYGDFVYAVSTRLLLDQSPDSVVILEIYGRETILKSTDFLERYQLIHSLPTEIYGSESMMVFERVD